VKFSCFLSIALLAGMLPSNARAQSTGPFVWNSYVDVAGNYILSNAEGLVISRFDPGVSISVTRMQLQAAHGSYIATQNNPKCKLVPKIKLTDGTTEFALRIPNARKEGTFPASVSADSGPIGLVFPANASLHLKMVPGESRCNPASINVTVQYTVNGGKAGIH
jgi:hypothetical protein